jgi:hypothetical protein
MWLIARAPDNRMLWGDLAKMELHIIVPIWNVFFLAMCIGISVFCVGLIVRGCLSETRWPLHSFALIAFFLIMFAQSADALNQLISPESDISWMFAITLPMVPALGGCMWFYVIGLTSPDRRFLRADLWHLLPIAIIVACTLPFLLLPQDQRQSFLGESVNLQSRGQVVAVTFMLVGWLTWLAILASYGVASMRRLFQYRAQVKELLSNVDGVSLTWLHVLIVIIFTVTGLTIIASLMPVTVSMSRIADFLAPLFYFCVVFAVGSFGVLQDSVIPNWSELDLNIGSKKKYERSTLQVKDMLRIASKLHERMKQDQLWQNPEPPRVCRRLILVSYAATERLSRLA